MTDSDEDDSNETLKGQDAIDLWKQGPDVWNKWADSVTECDVDFSGVDFSEYRNDSDIPDDRWPFEEYRFPDGDINFSNAQFGEGTVHFDNAKFRSGDVSFNNARFGDGDVSFNNVRFGDGNVYFFKAQFGEGNVNFLNAQFGKGFVTFHSSEFGDGTVSFRDAQFGNGGVSFENALFGNGDVDFERAQFGKGGVYFISVQFGDGRTSFQDAQFRTGAVDFSRSQFGDGDINFKNVKFGDAKLLFRYTQCGKGPISFSNASLPNDHCSFYGSTFEDFFYFSNLKNCHETSKIDFSNCSFERSLIFSADPILNCVPDLRQTKTGHHVSLNGLKIRPRKMLIKRFGFVWIEAANDEEDADRLIRLKQLAQDNKDHDAALEFLALEQQAKRWVRMGNFMSLVDIAYSAISDYGRSIGRPLALLILLCFGFAYGYDALSRPAGVGPYQHVSAWFGERGADALVYSATGTIPLVPAARKAAGESYDKLGIDASDNRVMISFLTMLQGLLSTILLFLIGLALRNRFRV